MPHSRNRLSLLHHTSKLGYQFLYAEWFGQESVEAMLEYLLGGIRRVICGCRDEAHLRAGRQVANRLQRCETIDVRHDQVDDDYIGRMRLKKLQRCIGRRHGIQVQIMMCEDKFEQFTCMKVIVQEED